LESRARRFQKLTGTGTAVPIPVSKVKKKRFQFRFRVRPKNFLGTVDFFYIMPNDSYKFFSSISIFLFLTVDVYYFYSKAISPKHIRKRNKMRKSI
jgi:hypothetical protein